MQEAQFAPKAAMQILRGWNNAGVDFLPTAGVISANLAEQRALELSENFVSPAVSPSSMSIKPPVIEQEEMLHEMRKPAKQESIATAANEFATIWPAARQLSLADRSKDLADLRLEVASCVLCKELAQCRTQTVFGVGNMRPRLCFFGEAPGADEDKQGEPFVGRAGQLLDKIIEAMTLKRSDVYILNTLKCRPPGNRTPLPDEVENCRRYFTSQLEILSPEFVVCLGACAAQALLRTKESIGKLRGLKHDYRGIKVYATYHPAYLLRNPPAKRDVWEDMKVVMKEMGIAIPKS